MTNSSNTARLLVLVSKLKRTILIKQDNSSIVASDVLLFREESWRKIDRSLRMREEDLCSRER